MPYISPDEREKIDAGRVPETPGQLNYVVSRLIDAYLTGHGPIRYAPVNEVIGVLECAKIELYRRVAASYEDRKMNENGDVYAAGAP